MLISTTLFSPFGPAFENDDEKDSCELCGSLLMSIKYMPSALAGPAESKSCSYKKVFTPVQSLKVHPYDGPAIEICARVVIAQYDAVI